MAQHGPKVKASPRPILAGTMWKASRCHSKESPSQRGQAVTVKARDVVREIEVTS